VRKGLCADETETCHQGVCCWDEGIGDVVGDGEVLNLSEGGVEIWIWGAFADEVEEGAGLDGIGGF
jgi:hypothetical protein